MMEIAGVRVPDSSLCNAVTAWVRGHSEPYLFNHVMRSYVFAELIGRKCGMAYDPEILYFSAVMHDLGLTSLTPVQQRFEIEGADAARAFLVEHGVRERDADIVWDAIALHTTAEIPVRKGAEIALCHLGIAADLRIVKLDATSEAVVDEVRHAYPDHDMKEALLKTLVALFKKNPAAAASHAVADVCERMVQGFRRFNLCDVLLEKHDHAPPSGS